MFKTLGGDRETHVSSRWYEYETNRLVHNIDKIKTYFPGRTYISGEDIVDYIAYCKYGCFLLLNELREMKKKLKNYRRTNSKWALD